MNYPYINDVAKYMNLNPGHSDWNRELLVWYELKCYEWILRSSQFKDLPDNTTVQLVSGNCIPIVNYEDYIKFQ